MSRGLESLTVETVLTRWPFVGPQLEKTGSGGLADRPEAVLGEVLDAGQLRDLDGFITAMEEFLGAGDDAVRAITVRGGRAKDGAGEPVRELTIRSGEVVCIVGPTGSGKSRLLADIEWVARGDTPPGRHVLVDGAVPGDGWRFGGHRRLVAQLSQNMNFVMDLTVEEFLRLHAESRQAAEPEDKIRRIWEWANDLAGEPFAPDTPVTSLSGGQSRALMIADTAVLSASPVVLIDEIENAGIDRRRALEILIREEKIVLMATHDPILALMGDRRVVIENGAMRKVIEPSERERANLEELRALDDRLMVLRHRLRMGERLDEI